jgi:hypothetical protein
MHWDESLHATQQFNGQHALVYGKVHYRSMCVRQAQSWYQGPNILVPLAPRCVLLDFLYIGDGFRGSRTRQGLFLFRLFLDQYNVYPCSKVDPIGHGTVGQTRLVQGIGQGIGNNR